VQHNAIKFFGGRFGRGVTKTYHAERYDQRSTIGRQSVGEDASVPIIIIVVVIVVKENAFVDQYFATGGRASCLPTMKMAVFLSESFRPLRRCT
jgi:hypothetical protein